MSQLLVAIIGLFGALLGILVGAWRQEALQRSLSSHEDLRRWQQERREAYLRFMVADDELHRGLVRDMRALPPGRSSDDPTILGLSGVTVSPLTPEQRLEVIGIFDDLWRAKRTIELFHLVDDDLLASANRLVLIDAELVGLMVFDLNRVPENIDAITVSVSALLQERHFRINEYMQQARIALNVPSANRNETHANGHRRSLTDFSRYRRAWGSRTPLNRS